MFSGDFQQFGQAGRARAADFDAVHQQADFLLQRLRVGRIGTVLGMQFFQQRLGLGNEAGAQFFLRPHQGLNHRLVLAVLVVDRDDRRAADDQRRARFVDQNGIHFIDNSEIMAALHLVLAAGGHAVVAQVIEAEFGVGAVGDVAIILRALRTAGD